MSSEPPRQPEIGTDTWVAQHEQRVEVRSKPLSRFLKRLDRVPITLRVVAVVVLLALLPTLDSSDYIQQVAVNAALLALLALGLNVVVGMAGMLDLGYTAFYGIGAYLFAVPRLAPAGAPLAEHPGAPGGDGGHGRRGRAGRPADAPAAG